jgi:hypothetical protein
VATNALREDERRLQGDWSRTSSRGLHQFTTMDLVASLSPEMASETIARTVNVPTAV